MKGIMAKKSNGYCVLIGRVVNLYRPNRDMFEVTVEYSLGAQKELTRTTIVFANQQPEQASGKTPVPWADMAFRLRLRAGSVIGCVVWFPGSSLDRCCGYKCMYRGQLYLTADEEDADIGTQNVIGGRVTWVREKTRHSGQNTGKPFLSVGVSIGRDRSGCWQSVVVNIYDERIMQYAKRALMPRDGQKADAWFRCGEPIYGTRADGTQYGIYTAYDFTVSQAIQQATA